MSEEDEILLHKLLMEESEYQKFNKLESYSPYPFQLKFHNDTARFRDNTSANRPGKCASYQTLIDTTNGRKRIGDIFGTECEVLTYPSLKPRKVVGWVRKSPEECFRITMSDGQWIECPRGHRILTPSGYLYVWQLLDVFPFLIEKDRYNLSSERAYSPCRTEKSLSLNTSLNIHLVSNSDIFQLVRVLNVRHCIRKLRDYLDDYLVGFRLRDVQPLYDQDNVQVFPPSQDGALQQFFAWYNLDDLANKYIYSPLSKIFHLSSQYVSRLISAQFEIFSNQVSSWRVQHAIVDSQNTPLFSSFVNRQQLTAATSTHQVQKPYLSPISVNGNHIVSFRSVGVKTLYDMEVEERHNYIAGGMVNHNTLSGGAEMAIHLTGKYPDWWDGRKFDKPVLGLASGKNNEKTRDLVQKELFGDPANEKEYGTGWVPKLDIVKAVRKPGVPDAKYHIFVKHYTDGKYDGDSKITLLAYDMGKESWMGFAADIVWLDEEPPEDIMGQATRSIVDRGGSIYMTFTPENGRTAVLIAISKSWSNHHATWMDAAGEDFDISLPNGRKLEFKTVYGIHGQAGHLTEEKVTNALKGMLPHELEMRVLGEPMQGSGLIFSYPQDQVMCEPIEIPDHFKRLCAIDFGGISQKSHPSAVVWIAYDESNDTAYVYDCLKLFSNDPAEVAARMLSRPQWITTHFPHDMMKTVAGGGTVADLYKKYGINMFHTHVTNPNEEKGEGKGGIKIEPGLIDMNARFADRRLRIFNTLPEIWDEIRNYHTTKTTEGSVKIVYRDDDLISAIRYCLMMLRHAITEDDVIELDDGDYWEEEQTHNRITGY